jgi:hypothetical protein
MIGLFCFALAFLASPFRSKLRLEAENAVPRHQLIVLRRRPRGRVRLTNHDRWFFIQLYRWFPVILKVLTIIRPETLVRWHRAGLRCYWRWRSRPRVGRPLTGCVSNVVADEVKSVVDSQVFEVVTIVQPETLVHWHRAGFRRFLRCKSHRRGGRPQIDTELRVWIRRMSNENPIWSAPREGEVFGAHREWVSLIVAG